jgi:hypothetical protein
VDALCGWNAAGAHLFFLEELERPRGRTAAAAEHFVRTRAALELPVLERLEHEVARRYVADDWREAARARALARALDPPRSVPIWIEALAAWERRGTEGKGSRRIQGEILADLQQLSGRSIGPDPHLWSTWWEAVRSGRIALPADRAAAGEQSSSAAFFGLHVATDRVLFVVDRSGSMRAAFGTGRRSRHEEAIDQLESFLRRSGEETQFSIAVFNGKGDAWRSHLVPASPANLADARGWLAGRSPQGATNLFAGLAAGLDLDAHGRLELERCEADTVIVLCDGATEEGPSWVRGWLGEQNESAQLVFHCVQIGSGGDGTLEALAAGTGGKFLRIEG